MMVSVLMITYGHEKYIRQAIEGVLMQETDFDLELVIANDCSPDNTDAIIRQIILENKSKCSINYFLHENNLGIMPNFYFALEQCKGQYIALCEGDDYWTDPFKLQKQVDFLEANPEIAACFTNAQVCNHMNNTSYPYHQSYKLEEGILNNDILFDKGGGIYPTCTLVYRRDLNNSSIYISEIAGDELLLFTIADKHKIAYQNFNSATYNRWNNGVFSGILENPIKVLNLRKKELIGYKKLLPFLNNHNKQLLKKRMKKVALFVVTKEEFSISQLKYLKLIGIKPFLKKILK